MTCLDGRSAEQPPIPFDASKWQGSLGGWWPIDVPHTDRISRDDLFRFADEWRLGARPASDLFALTMAWGYGNVGYGRYRTQRMLRTADATEKLERALEALRAPELAPVPELRSAYQALARGGASRLHGLGPAFFTKLLYFAGFRRGTVGVQPLIVDARVARALRVAGGPALRTWGWSSEEWLTYLAWASEKAAERNVSADAIELRLFECGRRRLR